MAYNNNDGGNTGSRQILTPRYNAINNRPVTSSVLNLTPWVSSADYNAANPQYRPTPGPSNLFDGFKGLDTLKAIAQQGINDATNDPYSAIMEYIRNNSYQYNGPSAEDLANREAGPQLEALKQIAAATQARYGEANKNVGSMYDALAQATRNRIPASQQSYDDAGAKIASAYKTAQDNTQGSFNQSMDKMTEMMSRLGIQQAAPELANQQAANLAKQQGALSERASTAGALNSQLSQNETAHINRTADNNALAGRNAQYSLTQKLMDAMYDNENKRLGVEAGRGKAIGDYAMSIEKLKQAAADSQGTNILKLFQQKQDSQRYADDQALKMAGLDLDKKKFDASQAQQQFENGIKNAQSNSQSLSKEPFTALRESATSMFPDPQAASNAVSTVTEAYRQSVSAGMFDAKGFMDKVYSINPNLSDYDKQRYAELAGNLYARMKG